MQAFVPKWLKSKDALLNLLLCVSLIVGILNGYQYLTNRTQSAVSPPVGVQAAGYVVAELQLPALSPYEEEVMSVNGQTQYKNEATYHVDETNSSARNLNLSSKTAPISHASSAAIVELPVVKDVTQIPVKTLQDVALPQKILPTSVLTESAKLLTQ